VEVLDHNPPCQQLYVCTYNARSLLSHERLIDFKQAISNIKYDIIGLAEIRRTGYNIEEDDDHIFCSYGQTKGQYGVGFIIKKKYKQNIESFVGVSERICVLKLYFGNTKLSLIQVHAPTTDSSEEDIIKFYDLLQQAYENCEDIRLILGDFNARVGQRLPGEEKILGKYCYGKRDKRGETLLQFCHQNNLVITNGVFRKKIQNLWTWLSPKN
jgi:exonuclease III